MFWWLMTKIILTVGWLSGILSAEIFISTGEWVVQMLPLTAENSHFLRSRPQKAALVMLTYLLGILGWVIPLRHLAGISAFVWSSAGMMRIWHLLVGGSSHSPLCCWWSVDIRLFCKSSSLALGSVLRAGSETVCERRKGLICTCYAHIYNVDLPSPIW